MVRKKIGKISQKVIDINDAYVSNIAPSNEMLRNNMLWIDTTDPNAKKLKQYDGQNWNILNYDFESNTPVNSDKDAEDYLITIGNIPNDSKINYYERLALSKKFTELTGKVLNNVATFPTMEEITSSTDSSLIKTVYNYGTQAGISTSNLTTRYNEFKTLMESYQNPRITDTNTSNKFSDITVLSVTAYRNAWINLITAMRDISASAEAYWNNYNTSIKGELEVTPNENLLRNSDFYIKDNVSNLPLGAWKDYYKNNNAGTSIVVDISNEITNMDFKNAYRIVGQTSVVTGILNAPISVIPSQINSYSGKKFTLSLWKKSTNVTGVVNARLVLRGKDSTGAVVNSYTTLIPSSNFSGSNSEYVQLKMSSANFSIPSNMVEITGLYFDLHFNGATGTLDVTGMKLEVSNTATSWVPNPLDFDEKVKGATFSITPEGITSMVFNTTQWTQISQKADRIDLVVGADGSIKGTDIASSIALTPSAIDIISENINLSGKVTFSTFDSSLQTDYNNTKSTASSANSTASSAMSTATNANNTANSANSTANSANNKVIGLGLPNSTTTIHGGNIQTGTMSANVINTGTLNSIQINNGNGAFTVSSSGAMTATNALITSVISGIDDETNLSATNSVELGNGRIVVQQYGGSTNSTQTITLSGNSGLQFRTSKNSSTNMRIDVYESESTSSKGVYKIHAMGSTSELRIISDGNLVARAPYGILLGNSTTVQGQLSVTSTATFSSYAVFNYGLEVNSGNGIYMTSTATLNIGSNATLGSTYLNIQNVNLTGELGMTSSGIIRGSSTEVHIVGRLNSSHNYGHLRVTSTTNGGFIQSESIVEQTTTASANIYIQSSGHIKMTSSSIRYKINIEEQPIEKSKQLLGIVPKTWHDKIDSERYANYLTRKENGEVVDDSEWQQCSPIRRIGGLIAEEVEQAGLKEFVFYEDDGVTPQGLMYDRIWTLLIPIVKEHENKLDEMQRKIDELQAIIDSK